MSNKDNARSRFSELRGMQGEGVSPNELDEIWAALDTTDASEIIGAWKGEEFVTGHPMNGRLTKARWYGKTFNSLSDVQPLVCIDDAGNQYSNVKMGKGEASLWNVEFRGEVTATMVYDGQPVFDHFKKVDDNTLMGIMNAKDIAAYGGHFYFVLERA